MDRELTEDEKVALGKKHQRKGNKVYRPARISNQWSIKWLVFSIFLCGPMLVKYGTKRIGITIPSDSPEVVAHQEEAILQIYAARTWGPKGLFAVHSWIAMKRSGSKDFEVSQIIGWRQDQLGNVLFRETGVPINTWWGNEATLLLDIRGDSVERIIDKVDVSIEEYPWKNEYRLYPGPNSNTFIAWLGLQVPELGLDLPSTAIGKDWRPWEHSIGPSVSGTGFQASLFGLLGASIGWEEGIEINILGLNFELDLLDLAVEIPLFGRYEIGYLTAYLLIWLLIGRLKVKAKASSLKRLKK